MIVTFSGHSKIIIDEQTRNNLYNYVETLIKEGADTFLLGGYGNFDYLAAKTVKKLKVKYPNIKSILVISYIDNEFDKDLYDESVYPPLEFVPKKFAIIKRNEWMVEKCDILVSYVKYSFGGAAKTLEFAKKKNKRIIDLT